jgi:PIN domain nuclease of toxin-antitoxin system
MKLLLDTHIWLWSVANSERLSAPSESWAQEAMSLAPLREAPSRTTSRWLHARSRFSIAIQPTGY